MNGKDFRLKPKDMFVLGSKISIVNSSSAIGYIIDLLNQNRSHYICVANVHTVVTGKKSETFRRVTNTASLVLPDGMPLKWISRCLGQENLERCAGPDIMSEVFKISERMGYKHYFYGSTDTTLNNLLQNVKAQFPKLDVVGVYSPPFRKLTRAESEEIVSKINEVRPDFVWVGLGAPKQEYWMHEYVDKISHGVLLGVGAAFDFHAGTVKRAPVWIQKIGLEWSFRLIQEPRRLWKRYLVTNTLFVWYIVLSRLGIKHS